jgi:hypothetical protein
MLKRSFGVLLLALSAPFIATAQERPADPVELVRAELAAQGFHTDDLAEVVVKDQYRSTRSGLQHTYIRQRWQGIEVWNGDLAVHQGPDGRLVKLNNGGWSGVAKRVNATTPALTPEAALALVLNKDGVKAGLPALLGSDAALKQWKYDGTRFSGEPVTVQLVYQPVNDRLLLAWNVSYYMADGSHWWNVRVDALTGAELQRNDWVSQCAFDLPADDADHDHLHGEAPAPAPAAPNDYRVFPAPLESPSHGARAVRNAPWTLGGIASPFGWHDTNGAVGADNTDTRGNNCRAQDDLDANNTGGTRPSGGATLDFDFALDLTQAPGTYLSAATTNLFYWNNIMHDVWYQYGFDEPAGNFQQNNYGRGGTGNDWVNADAQDGSGTNNANFSTPPDGSTGRMQMFVWTSGSTATPDRDSDLDNGVIAHEYGHGISTRLVGGPSNSSCLGNAEQMGEGWSDYFGLMMTMEPGDQGSDARGIGTYVTFQPVSGGGIRPAPYSTNFAVNSYTYANTNSGVSQPHGIGFVWCTMLWEMTWDLIAQYGFDPDLYDGNGGNNIAMQLVIDGLKLTPCNPGFVDARDAILQADVIANNGANQNLIWSAFARRGLGSSASQGSSGSRSDQVESFDTPMPNNVGISGVVEPAPGVLFDCAASGLTVRATVRNFGQAPQTGFPVRYQLDGGAVISETFTGTLAPGTAVTYVFATPLTITGIGAHTLVVSTALPGDGASSNDAFTANLTLTATTLTNQPFTENVTAGVVTPTGWFLQNPDNSTTWTTQTLTNGANCASTVAWGINHYSYNAPGQEDRLISPSIDLAVSGNTRLKFDRAYAPYSAAYNDAFRVDVSNDCGRTWNQVYYAVGSALATTTATTSSYVPGDCSQWQNSDLDLSAYDGQRIIVRFSAINDYGNWFYLDNVQVVSSGLAVPLKLMLEGPYATATNRMSDDLRTAGLIPSTEPYTALGFTEVGGGGATLQPSALTVTGDNAIVDWVMVELRDAAAPATVIATRSALLQRDGDVVGLNGIAPVVFTGAAGNYHVSVRHRNHLGVMTGSPVALGTSPAPINFTLPGTATFGTDARKNVNGVMVLWTGNTVPNTQLSYTGSGNDRDPILLAIGGSVPTGTLAGYRIEDTNLDGVVKYTGSANDRDAILLNIGGSVPTATRTQQLP